MGGGACNLLRHNHTSLARSKFLWARSPVMRSGRVPDSSLMQHSTEKAVGTG